MKTSDDKKLLNDVNDLLNQIALKLKDVPDPEVQDFDYGGDQTLCYFDENTDRLQNIKVVVKGILDKSDEKMARAYYTSFCNG